MKLGHKIVRKIQSTAQFCFDAAFHKPANFPSGDNSKLFFDKGPENPVPVKKLLNHFKKHGDYKQLAVHYIWEDLWWKRKNEHIFWLEKLIRV